MIKNNDSIDSGTINYVCSDCDTWQLLLMLRQYNGTRMKISRVRLWGMKNAESKFGARSSTKKVKS